MTTRPIVPLLALLGATLASCGGTQDIASSDLSGPPTNWITEAPIHSVPTSGSVSDAASGSTVLDGEPR
jgi:hypothetical protein